MTTGGVIQPIVIEMEKDNGNPMNSAWARPK